MKISHLLLEPIESNSRFFRAKNLLIRVIYYTSPLRGQTWHFSFFGAIKSLSRSHTPPRPVRAAINSYQSHTVECMRALSQTKEAMTYTNTTTLYSFISNHAYAAYLDSLDQYNETSIRFRSLHSRPWIKHILAPLAIPIPRPSSLNPVFPTSPGSSSSYPLRTVNPIHSLHICRSGRSRSPELTHILLLFLAPWPSKNRIQSAACIALRFPLLCCKIWKIVAFFAPAARLQWKSGFCGSSFALGFILAGRSVGVMPSHHPGRQIGEQKFNERGFRLCVVCFTS